MKKFYVLLTAIFMSLSLLAQTPQGINYQTVIRDGDGNILPYTELSLQMTIRSDAPDGDVVYSETHSLQTNGFGLVNLVIGQGIPVTGQFDEIVWSDGEFYLETGITFDGSPNYIMVGVTQLLTVPFSKYADFAGGLKSMTTEDRDALQNLSVGYAIYNTTTNCLNYWNGNNWFETCGDCTPQPSQAEAGDDQYFSDETTATYLQGNTPESGNGLWSVVSGSGGTFDDANDPETLFTGLSCESYILMWEISTSCSSTSDQVSIQFDAIPTTAEAGQDILINTEELTVSLSANTPLVGSGLWTVVNGDGGVFDDANNPQTNFTGLPCESYILRWSIATDCHESFDEIEVTFDDIPTTANGGEDITINTEDFSVQLSANIPEVGTGIWTIVEGVDGVFEDATDPETLFTGLPCETYNLSWTITTDCYVSADEIEVVFDAIPTVADAGEDIIINTEELSITLVANIPEVGTGTWSIYSGEGGLLDDPSNPESGFTGMSCTEYTLQWSIATECHVTTATTTVVFDAIPTPANAGEAIIITSDELSVNLEANTPEVGSGIWTILSGEGGFFAEDSDPNTLFTGLACTGYELAWTISTACHVATATTTVTFFHTPTQADAGEDQLGLTGTWTNLAANTPENGTGLWSILSGEGGTLTNPTSPTTILLGQNLQHYVLKWETTTECAISSDTVNVAFGFVPFLNCGDSLYDLRDDRYYTTVQIGNQCWMSENLAYLPEVSPSSLGSFTDPYYYVHGYQETNVAEAKSTTNYHAYGVLYNWPASLTACPSGWHLPNDEEWTQLVDYLVAQGFHNSDIANSAGNALKSCRQVNSPLVGGCNTTVHPRWESHGTHHGFDEFGFSALPGGQRSPFGNDFYDLGYLGAWWASSEHSGGLAWIRGMNPSHGFIGHAPFEKGGGYSVRCLRD